MPKDTKNGVLSFQFIFVIEKINCIISIHQDLIFAFNTILHWNCYGYAEWDFWDYLDVHIHQKKMYRRILLGRCILFTVSYSNKNFHVTVSLIIFFINNIEILQPKINVYQIKENTPSQEISDQRIFYTQFYLYQYVSSLCLEKKTLFVP